MVGVIIDIGGGLGGPGGGFGGPGGGFFSLSSSSGLPLLLLSLKPPPGPRKPAPGPPKPPPGPPTMSIITTTTIIPGFRIFKTGNFLISLFRGRIRNELWVIVFL